MAQFLSEEDYGILKEGNYLFARKFGEGSEALAEHIFKNIGADWERS